MSEYPAIGDLRINGNMHTSAIVSTDGSINWLCLPHFNFPAVFCSILDRNQGGHFKLEAQGEDITRKQFFWPRRTPSSHASSPPTAWHRSPTICPLDSVKAM